LHIRFGDARLRPRGQRFGVGHNLIRVQIKPVAMAIRASCDAPGHYGLAALADFVVLRRFDDLLGAGRALGEMAIRHFFEQYPIALKVSMLIRQRQAKGDGMRGKEMRVSRLLNFGYGTHESWRNSGKFGCGLAFVDTG
jgi:hypothetical protein